MSKIFNADNAFNRFLYKIGSLILVNIYFLLCSIPVITIGASLTAANTVCYKMKEETDVSVTRTFFKAFVSNLLDATILWIIFAGFLSMCGYMIYKALVLGGREGMVIGIITGIITLVLMMGFTFIFVLLARYNNFITRQIGNAFMIGFVNFFYCLAIWAIWAAFILPFAANLVLFKYLGWLWLMCGFSGIIYITMGIYRKVLNVIENKSEE